MAGMMGGDPAQMQQQLMQNPDMMRQMLNSPVMTSLMNNPDIMRSLIEVRIARVRLFLLCCTSFLYDDIPDEQAGNHALADEVR